MRPRLPMLCAVVAWACTDTPQPGVDLSTPEPEDSFGEGIPLPSGVFTQDVQVFLDGEPAADVMVMQGGTLEHRRTDGGGRATLNLSPEVLGGIIVVAAHEAARIRGVNVTHLVDLVTVELTRVSPIDNLDYVFQDPGTPERNGNTSVCSHCHVRQVEDWVDHPHALSASNPVVHDVYGGAAQSLDAEACAERGGRMEQTRAPGGGRAKVCIVGAGVLPDLNPECDAPCEAPRSTGACADCHAPGIDGQLGGRDLLEATGIAYDHGIHCDVCHKVRNIDLDAPPGVAGRLGILRPSEVSSSPTFDYAPLTYAPLPDVLNPRMGAVYAPVYEESVFCAGCHEHDQPALVPGTSLDPARWPDGVLPIQSTFSEWRDGPHADDTPCQACHMPPDAEAGNSSDIDIVGANSPGRASGWWRPPGSSRQHVWTGPRDPNVDMVALALTLQLEVEDGVATTTVVHTGPGHAVPTGEPMRSLVLRVEATCEGGPLAVVDGPAIPAFAGALERRPAGEDWAEWPRAEVGDVVRVVRNVGWVEYAGHGPFGNGRFTTEQKGLPDQRVVGESTVLSLAPTVLSRPLPEGDWAMLGRPPGEEVQPLAGAAGFAFARVLSDSTGALMVPHHAAVDIVSDNRLLPGMRWQTEHTLADCEAPQVTATLSYRAYPWALAEERGWSNPERVVARVQR